MRRVFHFVIASLAAFWSGAALADAINGDWCNKDGSHLRIDGPQIELAPGQLVQGKYSRHAFSYIAPKGDFDEGKEILFILRSETEMRRVRSPNAMPLHEDTWQRCAATS